jgi:uncharacterized protein YjbI with pentapeptide repeats
MKTDQLKEILCLHKLWVYDEPGAKRADLSGADLSGASLRGACLIAAYLSDADLRGADLSGANLRNACLSGADLRGACMVGAYLRDADLSGAIISEGVTAKRLIARATRLCDGDEGFLFETESGELFGLFDCRAMSLDDFEKHVATYGNDDPRKGQSEDIIAYFRAAAARAQKEEAA